MLRSKSSSLSKVIYVDAPVDVVLHYWLGFMLLMWHGSKTILMRTCIIPPPFHFGYTPLYRTPNSELPLKTSARSGQ